MQAYLLQFTLTVFQNFNENSHRVGYLDEDLFINGLF